MSRAKWFLLIVGSWVAVPVVGLVVVLRLARRKRHVVGGGVA